MTTSLDRDLVEVFAARVKDTPDAPYVSALDAGGELETHTFVQIWRAAQAAASEFPAPESESLVALVPASDVCSVVALWGALVAGHGVLMLDPAWSQDQRAEIAAAYGASLVDHRTWTTREVDPVVGHQARGPAERPSGDPARTALVFNTSGSTGVPKAVALPHTALLANAHSFAAHHSLTSDVTILSPLPLHHSNAVNTCLMSPLVSGGHSVLIAPSALLDLPRWIRAVRPTIISAVPSVLDALLKVWRGEPMPASVRYALSAAAPLSRDTASALLDRLGLRVVQAYGLSETVNFSTTMPVDLTPEDYRALMVDRPTPSVGIAIQDVALQVCDAAGSPLPHGEIGEVLISGPALMSGYLGAPEETARVLQDGVFRTGDLGYLEERPGVGALLYLTGRSKNVAKVRGEQVSCEEVEHILRAMPNVDDAGCIIVPDARDGERLLAAVVSDDDAVAAAILAELRSSWPDRIRPQAIVLVDAIPRTVTGKLRREELRLLVGRVQAATRAQ